MASIAISSTMPSSANQDVAAVKTAPQPDRVTTKASAVLQPDTVKLSAAAQARMMHKAGQSPALIAATLGRNVVSVDGYLGIKAAKQVVTTPVPAAAQSAQPESTPAAPTQQASPQPAAAAPAASGKS